MDWLLDGIKKLLLTSPGVSVANPVPERRAAYRGHGKGAWGSGIGSEGLREWTASVGAGR